MVEESFAHNIATNFAASRWKTVEKIEIAKSEPGAYHVFNVNNRGFIVVAGDDLLKPILAYSLSKPFDDSDATEFLNVGNIKNKINQLKENDAEVAGNQKRWYRLRSQSTLKTARLTPDTLITTRWAQTYPFNALCPKDRNENPTMTGCVATAMAQVLHYWASNGAWIVGHGICPSYYCDQVGAAIPATTLEGEHYDWKNMLDYYPTDQPETTVDEPILLASLSPPAPKKEDVYITAVAKLMYHCGVSISANFGKENTSASIQNAAISLRDHFGFDPSIQMKYRECYSEEEWRNMILEQLTNRTPVIYRGENKTSSHCFICDGYDEETDLFHFVFGWGTVATGFYDIELCNSTSPSSSKNINYDEKQAMIVNAFPNLGFQESYELFVKNVSPHFDYYVPGETARINFTLQNKGITDWNGFIYCYLIDTANDTVCMVREKFSNVKKSSSSSSKYVSVDIPFDATDGEYRVVMYYSPYECELAQQLPLYDSEKHEIDASVVVKTDAKPHVLTLKKDGYDFHLLTDSVIMNDESTVAEYCLHNSGAEDFQGSVGLTITNEKNIALDTTFTEITVATRRYATTSTYLTFENIHQTGRYSIGFVGKADDGDDWFDIVSEDDSISHLSLYVTSHFANSLNLEAKNTNSYLYSIGNHIYYYAEETGNTSIYDKNGLLIKTIHYRKGLNDFGFFPTDAYLVNRKLFIVR